MCARLLAIVAVFCLCGLPATPQETPTIVVVDQERLFEASLFGRRIAREVEDLSTELAAENRAIEAELMAEERDLTERRAGLEAAEFRALADAFDAKVEELRAEQDAKARELVALRDGERQNFSRIVGPILLEYMRQSGAAIMLDRRSIVVSSERADVTEELIAMIDERVGDGPPLEPDGLSTPDESPGESAGTDITGESE